MNSKRKRRWLKRSKAFYIFAKAQVSAFIGGVSDYLVMIALTELLGIHYTISILLSGIAGAIVNFSINRHWAFTSEGSVQSPLGTQLSKFTFVVTGSILLKSLGTHLITRGTNLDYRISRLVVELIVSYGFNYSLLKYWVFRSRLN